MQRARQNASAPRRPFALSVAAAFLLLRSFAFSQEAPALNPPTLEPADQTPELQPAPGDSQTRALPTIEWTLHKTEDGAHPNGEEQAMLWLMNRARTDPTQEGLYLADTGNSTVESAIAYFSVDLDAMKAAFAQIEPRQPAAFDRRIYEGSLAHSLDMIERDAQDHDNQFQRVAAAGFQHNGGAASVYSYARDFEHAHAGFNIDWGPDGGAGHGMQNPPGHREGLMNSTQSYGLTNVGIAVVPESNASTEVGPLVVSIVYAQAWTGASQHFNKFLVGTVWEDENANELYDPGEGLSGVRVMPDSGTYYAVTGESGGYAIPVSMNREYTLAFSGGELDSPATRRATIAGESALVPWLPADTYDDFTLPAPLIPPVLSMEQHEDCFLVSWPNDPTKSYSVQRLGGSQTWAQDQRGIAISGDRASFEIAKDEFEGAVLFRVTVSPAATPQGS